MLERNLNFSTQTVAHQPRVDIELEDSRHIGGSMYKSFEQRTSQENKSEIQTNLLDQQNTKNSLDFFSTFSHSDHFRPASSACSCDSSGYKSVGSFEDVSAQTRFLNQQSKDGERLEKFGEGPQAGAAPAKKGFILKAAEKIPCLGIIFALFASFFLGTAGMLVKMTESVHGVQVAVFRAMIQTTIYSSIIVFRKLPFYPKANELKPVFGRALLGAMSITFSYYALKLIPLGDATTIRFSMPIWTLIISYLVLNEACNFFKILAVWACITGVVLIANPDVCVHFAQVLWSALFEQANQVAADSEQINYITSNEPNKTNPWPMEQSQGESKNVHQLEGSLLALSSSICLAMSLVAMRLCKETPAEITVLWLSIASVIIGSSLLISINQWSFPNNFQDFLFILLNGLCGSIGQWFITNALKIEQSGVISLARTADIQVAFLYSAFLLHEQIKLTSIIGSLLVSCGVLAIVLPRLFSGSSVKNDASLPRPAGDSRPPIASITVEANDRRCNVNVLSLNEDVENSAKGAQNNCLVCAQTRLEASGDKSRNQA